MLKNSEIKREKLALEIPTLVKEKLSGKVFYAKTFGCQANVRDEETLDGLLLMAGLKKTDDPRKADLALINTCAVRENAEEKIYGEIGSFKENWEKNRDFILIVSGCVVQEEGIPAKLLKSYPWLSLCLGTHEVPYLLKHLEDYLKRKKPVVATPSVSGLIVEDLPSLRYSSFQAFVNISYGCDKFCTYCIVPYLRGRERSRMMDDVLRECQNLKEEGFLEVTLLGQNVDAYGLDFKDPAINFAVLLKKVAELGIPRVRFLTSYPSQLSDETIEVMATHKNIIPWLHLPVQSGSTSCLKRMGRRYTREEYLELVQKLKNKIPDLAITTDIIVGFPGETEEEFSETLSLVDEVKFSSAFTFIYSPRKGTPAAKWEQVPSPITRERFSRLKEVVEKATSLHSDSLLGTVQDVLVEGIAKKGSGMLVGHTANGKPVNFMGPEYLIGTIAPVKINESHVYSLLGVLDEDPLIIKAKKSAYLLSLDPLLKERINDEKKIENSSLKKKFLELKKYKEAMLASPSDQDLKDGYYRLIREIEEDPLFKNRNAKLDMAEDEISLISDLFKDL